MWKSGETILKPAELSWEEAAGASLAYWVAYDMVVRSGTGAANDDAGMIGAGDWVLITGASSGVGVASLQIAKARGAKVIGTSSSQAKLDRLAKLGLDAGVCVRGPGFLDAVLKATDGRGVKLLVNNVGGGIFEDGMKALAYKGRLATVGYVDGVPVAMGGWRRLGDRPGLPSSHTAEIKRMYVAAAVRRRGLSRIVLTELETSARAAGLAWLVLETGLPQTSAVALYRTSGYTEVDGTPYGHYVDHPSSIHLGKSLG